MRGPARKLKSALINGGYEWLIPGCINTSLVREDEMRVGGAVCCDGRPPNLLVLLGLLPPPPPLQSVSLRSALHHGVQGFPQHQISVMEAPHP